MSSSRSESNRESFVGGESACNPDAANDGLRQVEGPSIPALETLFGKFSKLVQLHKR